MERHSCNLMFGTASHFAQPANAQCILPWWTWKVQCSHAACPWVTNTVICGHMSLKFPAALASCLLLTPSSPCRICHQSICQPCGQASLACKACTAASNPNRMVRVVQALLGAGASVVLEGQRVLPARTLENGFRFQYDTVTPAIKNILAT